MQLVTHAAFPDGSSTSNASNLHRVSYHRRGVTFSAPGLLVMKYARAPIIKKDRTTSVIAGKSILLVYRHSVAATIRFRVIVNMNGFS